MSLVLNNWALVVIVIKSVAFDACSDRTERLMDEELGLL